MASFIFSEAAGKFARYAQLPLTNDACIWVLLQSAGLESDTILRDYDSLSAILAASNDEATFTGYSRQTAVGVTVTQVDVSNAQNVDVTTDPSWTPTTIQSLGKILLCYDPDTTGGTDADIVPLYGSDCVITTTVSIPFTAQVHASGIGTATAA